MTGCVGRLVRGVAASTLMIGVPWFSDAQSASVSVLRAAFVYNFAKFTDWPADAVAAGAPIVFCVAADPEMADELEQMVKGRRVGPHALVVRRIDVAGDVRPCHLLYAAGLDSRRAAELVAPLQRSAVLTVGDFEEFTEVGGVARLFVEDGKMRFAFNVEAVQRARLRVSSKLLALARIVGNANVTSR